MNPIDESTDQTLPHSGAEALPNLADTPPLRDAPRPPKQSRLRLPAWIRRMAVVKLSTLMFLLVIIALLLALVGQGRSAREREHRLKERWGKLYVNCEGVKGMRALLGDLGIVILQDATQVELLTVNDPTGRFKTTPTGKIFGKEYADRIGRVFLEPEHYAYLNANDDSDPHLGLRLTRGPDSLELLFDSTGSGSGSPHQDVWFFVKSAFGERNDRRGGLRCFNSPELAAVLDEMMNP